MKVMPKLNIPIVPFHVNSYFPPMPSARRCYELGRVIAEALKDRPEKVAIMASGGLSHDPRGPRAGWIDAPLDRWVLEQLRSGDGEALCHLFEFDSDTLREAGPVKSGAGSSWQAPAEWRTADDCRLYSCSSCRDRLGICVF